MPKPAPNKYYIVNADAFDDNETPLAVTYHGDNNPLTITPLSRQSNQEWFIADYRKTEKQTISPKDNKKHQVCYKSAHELTVRPAHNYVWVITSGQDDKYTFVFSPTTPVSCIESRVWFFSIQSGDKAVFWDLYESAVGQPVYLSAGNPGAGAFPDWKLIAA
ncbi:hypothetical protein OG21DRAFT_1489225 [Imleria badia]|nr:hypothetical protein OG21DRAFT_1489225 [Imleria badia]